MEAAAELAVIDQREQKARAAVVRHSQPRRYRLALVTPSSLVAVVLAVVLTVPTAPMAACPRFQVQA